MSTGVYIALVIILVFALMLLFRRKKDKKKFSNGAGETSNFVACSECSAGTS